jgi:hypothetical protein
MAVLVEEFCLWLLIALAITAVKAALLDSKDYRMACVCGNIGHLNDLITVIYDIV